MRASHDVHDGVHRADLVEMHLVHAAGMDLALGFGQYPEDVQAALLHLLVQPASLDEGADVGPGTHHSPLVAAHLRLDAPDPLTLGGLRGDLHLLQAQLAHRLPQ
jgi:hypothetical protein